MKLLRVLVVLTAMIAGSLGVSAQDDEKPSMVDRLLEAARNGSPVVRPQAANRLVALRDTEGVRLAALGQELIEALGKFENLELRDRLWAAVDDPDFPWRPAAARGLAASIHDDELARAAAWCSDKLAAVRVAGISALDQLEAFTSLNGPRFYGLEPNSQTITLQRQRDAVAYPAQIESSDGAVTVFDPGFDLHWAVQM